MIESTGLEMLGDGEWHAHKHRTANKRRRWRKLHLGVDAQGFIVASELTSSGADDGRVGAFMIKEIGEIEVAIERFAADGAYDSGAIYAALTAANLPGVTIVILPSKTASRSRPVNPLLAQRDAAIGKVAEVGRRQSRKEAGAYRQAAGENATLRYKRIVGDRLRAKKPEAQAREAKIVTRGSDDLLLTI